MKIEDIENDLSLQIKSLNSVLERKIKTLEDIDVKDLLIKNMSNSSNAEKKQIGVRYFIRKPSQK